MTAPEHSRLRAAWDDVLARGDLPIEREVGSWSVFLISFAVVVLVAWAFLFFRRFWLVLAGWCGCFTLGVVLMLSAIDRARSSMRFPRDCCCLVLTYSDFFSKR